MPELPVEIAMIVVQLLEHAFSLHVGLSHAFETPEMPSSSCSVWISALKNAYMRLGVRVCEWTEIETRLHVCSISLLQL